MINTLVINGKLHIDIHVTPLLYNLPDNYKKTNYNLIHTVWYIKISFSMNYKSFFNLSIKQNIACQDQITSIVGP